MHVEFSRHASEALGRFVKILGSAPDVEIGGAMYATLPFPVTMLFGHPTERTIPWSSWASSPFSSFLGGMQAITSTAPHFSKVSIDAIHTCDVSFDGTSQTITIKKSHVGKLDMIIFERDRTDLSSLFGGSAVRGTMLHEYLASHFGLPIGDYYHVVTDLIADRATLPGRIKGQDPYDLGTIKPYPIGDEDPALFVADANMFGSEDPPLGVRSPFIRHVATPIFNGFKILHSGDSPMRFSAALDAVSKCRASDWRWVCEAYLRTQQKSYMLQGATLADRSKFN